MEGFGRTGVEFLEGKSRSLGCAVLQMGSFVNEMAVRIELLCF
jgi:hypothetical protein